MIPLNVLQEQAAGRADGARSAPFALALCIVEINEEPLAPSSTVPPQPGYLCEACLDAPAIHVVPAPWGGEMGVCDLCHQASAVAALPVLMAHEGQQTLWHIIGDPARLVAYRATAGTPLPTWWDRCVSTAPARVCVCGAYRLSWGEEETP